MRVAMVWRAVFARGSHAAPAPPSLDASAWRALCAAVAPLASQGLPSAEAIAALVEAPPGGELGQASRRARGVFHTPPSLARALATATFSDAALGAPRPIPRMLDPTCGAGALLLAAFEALARRGAEPQAILPCLHGWDLDPVAVEVCRLRLYERAGALSQALALPWPGASGPFRVGDTLAQVPEVLAASDDAPELILANPPFGNAIGRDTARADEERARFREAYPVAATGAYDRASLFVEWAVRATTGPVGLIVPRALLAAPYASDLREWVERTKPLRDVVRVDRHDAFRDAAVHVAGLVLDRAARPASAWVGDAGTGASCWSARTSVYANAASLAQELARGGTLADVATVSASCAVGEAYAWRDAVREAASADASSFRLVTSGALDPFVVRWGEQTQRYLKASYRHPVVPRAVMSARRQAQASSPKVLMPGLSAVLEAAVDAEGTDVGAVATLCVTVEERAAASQGAALRALATYLNSAVARAWFLAHFGAAGLSGGSVQVTKNKLVGLPVPRWVVDDAARAGAAAAVRSDVRATIASMSRALPPLPLTHAPPPAWFDAALALRSSGRIRRAEARAAFASWSVAGVPTDPAEVSARLASASLALVLG